MSALPCIKCGGARSGCDFDPFSLPGQAYHSGLCNNCAQDQPARATESDLAWHASWLEKEQQKNRAGWHWIEEEIGHRLLQLDETHPGFDRAAFEAVKLWTPYTEGEPLSLIIEGPPDRGKSRMLATTCRSMTLVSGWRCGWATEAELFDTIGAIGRPADREDAEDRLDTWRTAEILFIDDLGSCPLTEARFARMFALVDYRYCEGLPMAISTNRTPMQMAGRIERFWIGQGMSGDEATVEAHKLIRRIYGTNASPLAMVVECQESRVIVEFPATPVATPQRKGDTSHAASRKATNGDAAKGREQKGKA